MKRSLGFGSLVREIDDSSVIELRDIDSNAIAGEILDAIFREVNASTMDSSHKYTQSVRRVQSTIAKSENALPDRQTSGRTDLRLRMADRAKKEVLSVPIIWARISELQGYR